MSDQSFQDKFYIENPDQVWKAIKFSDFSGSQGVPKKPCFLAGTPVHTNSGIKKIEDVEVGDTVLCYDTENTTLSRKRVTELFRNHTYKYRVIETEGGDTIKATGQHLFYVKGSNTWIKTYQLKVGMHLYDAQNDRLVKITALTEIEEDVPTFNLEVEDHHNYLVGETGYVAHNGGKLPYKNSRKMINVSFYTLENVRGTTNANKVVYVGQTIQEVPVRGAQHFKEGKKAINSEIKEEIEKFGYKAKTYAQPITGHQFMSQFEADIIELHYIKISGGRGELRNLKHPISKARFTVLKKNTNFNPCKYKILDLP